MKTVILVSMFLAGSLLLQCGPSEPETLKDAYIGHFKIGAALNRTVINGVDPDARLLAAKHMNSITPENVLKWGVVHPEPDQFNFELGDRFVEFGETHDMFIVGHTLVWHSQTPDWVFEDENGEPLTRKALLQRMQNHIKTVAGRYKDRIHAWDVVNEALNEDGSLRDSRWRQIIGDDYIQKAFEIAQEVIPDAELYYNDYNMWKPEKRAGVIREIKKLQDAGVPIHGVGLQGHWHLSGPSLQEIKSAIEDFSALGIKVMVTELDISVLPNPWDLGADTGMNVEEQPELDPYTEALPDSVQQKLSERYRGLFTLFLDHRNVLDRVTFWGVHDARSWLNNWPVPGRTNYPLLFDRAYQPKTAFEAVIDAAQTY